jgi:hypothetical protein
MLMSSKDPRTAPIGTEAPTSPADRVRQIQMMQASMAPVVSPSASNPVAPPSPGISDKFAIGHIDALRHTATKAAATDTIGYSKAQQTTQALFGGSDDIEVLGNPWKVIPFGEAMAGLFESGVEMGAPVVPNKAVKTEWGSLFEIGMSGPTAGSPMQKRAVLVDGQGKLSGAECRTPQELTRLFSHASWLLPAAASTKGTSWKVSVGANSAFTLEFERKVGTSKSVERVPLNNFGLAARSDVVVANYYLDRFDAAV